MGDGRNYSHEITLGLFVILSLMPCKLELQHKKSSLTMVPDWTILNLDNDDHDDNYT